MKRNASYLAIVVGLAVAGAIAQAHEFGAFDESVVPDNAILEENDGAAGSQDFGMWADEHGIRDTFGIQD